MNFKYIAQEYIGKETKFIGASNAQVAYGGLQDPRKYFTVGQILTIESAIVYAWKTGLIFKGYPNLEFNSVCFEEIKE